MYYSPQAGGWTVVAHNEAQRSEDYYQQPQQKLTRIPLANSPKVHFNFLDQHLQNC